MTIDTGHPDMLGVPAIKAIAALEDDLRRRMYAFARNARRPVTRDDVAAAVGISRNLAAFHLDKLVDAGLLRFHFAAVDGIRKVGRKPKVYEPSDTDVRVAIPVRQHEFLAEILAEAVLAERPSATASTAAIQIAAERGKELGAAERDRIRPGRLGAERALTAAEGLLAQYGFEPVRDAPACVRLRNCPFHPHASRAPELVCAMNEALLNGMLEGLQARAVHAFLDPRAGECCVELRRPSSVNR